MKTKTSLYISLILILFSNSISNADTIFFDSKNIKIEEDGNIIIAKQGTAKIPTQNILIEGDKSIYNKNVSELFITGNVKFFDDLNNVNVVIRNGFTDHWDIPLKIKYPIVDNYINNNFKTIVKTSSREIRFR